jgi:subtilase family serine protease
MQELHKKTGGACSLSTQRVANRYRLGTALLGGLASVCLLLTSGTVFAGVTTLELSPLIYKSTLVAPVDGNKEIGVVLALPSSDAAGLAAFVKHVSTPGDPLFHQYLTSQQFAERFGGSSADYAALKSWAAANGLSISQESVGRLALTVRGSASQFETLFKTQLNTYRTTDDQTFYSASIKPAVPAEIASKVSGIIGLTSSKRLAPLAKVVKTLGEDPAANSAQLRTDGGGTGPGGTYSCTDLRAVYEIPEWGNLEKGMICAVFEQGYYNPKDVETYFKKYNIGKNTKQTMISVDGSPITFENMIEAEACLDLDMMVGMNPDIAEVKVYIDDYNFDVFAVAMVDAFQAMADDKKPPQIVSVSYGQDEGDFNAAGALTTVDTDLQELAALGITVLASAGDNGAYGGGYSTPYNVSTPASDPYITGVGGTSLFTIGKSVQYANEIAWNELPSFGATGGGVSAYWQLPDYQNTPVVTASYVTANGGSATYRNVPDVSAVADPLTGVGIYVKDQGGWIQIGGTSASSPIWAGYLSNVNAAFKWSGLGPLGLVNPMLYAVGTPYYQSGRPYLFLFNPEAGSNGSVNLYGYPGYTAGVGYSNTTGNGTPWGSGFAIQLLISGTQSGTAPGAFTIAKRTPKATSCEITWTAPTGASAYAIGLFQYNNLGYNVLQAFLANSTSASYTFTGLTPNTPYGVNIWGYNGSGGSPPGVIYFTTKK